MHRNTLEQKCSLATDKRWYQERKVIKMGGGVVGNHRTFSFFYFLLFNFYQEKRLLSIESIQPFLGKTIPNSVDKKKMVYSKLSMFHASFHDNIKKEK